MSTQFYPKFRKACLCGDVDLDVNTVRACLYNSAHDAYDAANEFFSDLVAADVIGNAAGHTRADCPQVTAITTTLGVMDGNDVIITLVPAGGPYGAIILFIDSGADGTSRLIAFIDNATGLPITTDGHSVYLAWAALSPNIGIL